jgi:hypothetical protein
MGGARMVEDVGELELGDGRRKLRESEECEDVPERGALVALIKSLRPGHV